MSEDVSTSLSPPVTLGELCDLAGTQDVFKVEIHVRMDTGDYLPSELPVRGVWATTYRNGEVVITLDAT